MVPPRPWVPEVGCRTGCSPTPDPTIDGMVRARPGGPEHPRPGGVGARREGAAAAVITAAADGSIEGGGAMSLLLVGMVRSGIDGMDSSGPPRSSRPFHAAAAL